MKDAQSSVLKDFKLEFSEKDNINLTYNILFYVFCTLLIAIGIGLFVNYLIQGILWNYRRFAVKNGALGRLRIIGDDPRKCNNSSSSSSNSSIDEITNLNDLKNIRERKIVVGFFHPYCNAGGGGERVLWTAVKGILDEYKNTIIVIYTGDKDCTMEDILRMAEIRFNINGLLNNDRIKIIFLEKRYLISPEKWPHFTLIGQSLGAIPLAYEAICNLTPDIFVDTMGYAFSYPIVSWMLHIPIFSYTHYPTISTDMIENLLVKDKFKNINIFKYIYILIKGLYWRFFSLIYTFAGSYCDIVATNSSWTNAHIRKLWWSGHKLNNISILYPPCPTEDLQSFDCNKKRPHRIICVAQFRPEKRHELIIEGFANYIKMLVKKNIKLDPTLKLVLIGTVRNQNDKEKVEQLKKLTVEYNIDDKVEFIQEASWDEVKRQLKNSYIGINAMWNEHFGIGVVEYLAAGAIPIVHYSAGPRFDIVVPFEGHDTGFFFRSEKDTSDVSKNDSKGKPLPSLEKAIDHVFSLSDKEIVQLRDLDRKSVERFSEDAFISGWLKRFDIIMKMENLRYAQRHKLPPFN